MVYFLSGNFFVFKFSCHLENAKQVTIDSSIAPLPCKVDDVHNRINPTVDHLNFQ